MTYRELERLEENERAEEREALLAEEEERMEMFDAGRVSYRAARAGGDEYAREMAESEKTDELVAEPVAAALAGWLRAVNAGRRAA